MLKLRQLMMEMYLDGFISSDEKSKFSRPENFDSYDEGKGWTAYRGGNDWENGTTACAIYFGTNEEHGRIWFHVKFPKGISPDSDSPRTNRDTAEEWGEKAAKTWIRTIKKIHSVPKEYFQDGKPWYKDWKDCFIEATKSKAMKPYIKEWGIDSTKWKSMAPYQEPEKLAESKFIPGILEGWLDPTGKVHYVEDDHATWAAQYFNVPAPDASDVNAYETTRLGLIKKLYQKGWSRLLVIPEKSLVYFDTYDIPWRSLTKAQRQWIYDAATHETVIRNGEIMISQTIRPTPYKIEFGNKNETITTNDLS